MADRERKGVPEHGSNVLKGSLSISIEYRILKFMLVTTCISNINEILLREEEKQQQRNESCSTITGQYCMFW